MSDPIDLLIQGRAHDLGGGFAVRRVLPSVKRRMVGPFIFLDHFGPMDVPPGGGMEVRPHPHIGLATVTYCSRAASSIATAWATPRRSSRATSIG